jgi:hypothetical protein
MVSFTPRRFTSEGRAPELITQSRCGRREDERTDIEIRFLCRPSRILVAIWTETMNVEQVFMGIPKAPTRHSSGGVYIGDIISKPTFSQRRRFKCVSIPYSYHLNSLGSVVVVIILRAARRENWEGAEILRHRVRTGFDKWSRPDLLPQEQRGPVRVADNHSSLLTAEVKNAWSHIATTEHVFLSWCYITHENNKEN